MNAVGDNPGPSHDLQREAYDAFFNVIELLLKHRVTSVAEAAFQHDRWAPKLESLKQIAHIRIVVCAVDPHVARARHIARGLVDPGRERFHGDHAVQAAREGRELPIEVYDPPHLDVPTLHVNTTDGYEPAFESIVSFASGRSATRPIGR